jgi:hypothetical protein
MKKHIKTVLAISVLLTGLALSQVSLAQPPSPPASGNNGGSYTPMGGTAPIDGGIIFLLAAGLGYGARKVYNIRNSRKETI